MPGIQEFTASVDAVPDEQGRKTLLLGLERGVSEAERRFMTRLTLFVVETGIDPIS